MIPSPDAIVRAHAIMQSIEQLQAELASLFGSTGPAASATPKRRGRPPGSGSVKANPSPTADKKSGMSAAGRAAIAAAQRARWAKLNAAKKVTQNPVAPAPAVKVAKTRKVSAEGRAGIIAAAKARWAKVRAEKKQAAK